MRFPPCFHLSGTRPAGRQPIRKTSSDARLRERARAFEASFLAEMLKSAGLGHTPDSFGGGIGEEQVASMLRRQQARALVDAGGIGLSETIFTALKERLDD